MGFLGYVVIDQLTPGSPCAGGVVGAVLQPPSHRVVMLAAIGVENLCQGMATGAFGVMLLRMTQKQFSATQYALFSSIFAVGRIVTGPIAGFTADAIGWTPFYLCATAASIPGSAPAPALRAPRRPRAGARRARAGGGAARDARRGSS